MIWRTCFQLVSGIYNPAEGNFSWVVNMEFDTIQKARAALDRAILVADPLDEALRMTPELRAAYKGAPFAIIEVKSKIIERHGASATDVANVLRDAA